MCTWIENQLILDLYSVAYKWRGSQRQTLNAAIPQAHLECRRNVHIDLAYLRTNEVVISHFTDIQLCVGVTTSLNPLHSLLGPCFWLWKSFKGDIFCYMFVYGQRNIFCHCPTAQFLVLTVTALPTLLLLFSFVSINILTGKSLSRQSFLRFRGLGASTLFYMLPVGMYTALSPYTSMQKYSTSAPLVKIGVGGFRRL